MLMTTTPFLEGHPVQEYLGVVTGETIVGANIFKDIGASFRDVFGGRAGAWEDELRKARDIAMSEMAANATQQGANAIIGIDVDYESVGSGSMLMVSVSGTAVRI